MPSAACRGVVCFFLLRQCHACRSAKLQANTNLFVCLTGHILDDPCPCTFGSRTRDKFDVFNVTGVVAILFGTIDYICRAFELIWFGRQLVSHLGSMFLRGDWNTYATHAQLSPNSLDDQLAILTLLIAPRCSRL